MNLWLEIICRMPSMACTKVVDLCDSQSSTGALNKGRSGTPSFNALLRRRAALEILSQVFLLVGWTPSADQPMDRLSRTGRVVGPILVALRAATRLSGSRAR